MPASIHGEVDHLLGGVSTRRTSIRHRCPSRGFAHVARVFDILGVLGGNDGVSYGCTACGHSWS
ncbi:hypothetical protein DIZ27_15895 [Streptomyces sp. NWU339]|uniref:hypothetical protein n=1 Tax=Streptomyces sp. NWU339 TaxID=2185284 RepID=UPI000D67EEA8|nr:hypothetical protein [Streptomyces sp. NWU339]PWI09573.1 hypothetical protein DIZ27_15895 [Streptomyces sp. NWU339]